MSSDPLLVVFFLLCTLVIVCFGSAVYICLFGDVFVSFYSSTLVFCCVPVVNHVGDSVVHHPYRVSKLGQIYYLA